MILQLLCYLFEQYLKIMCYPALSNHVAWYRTLQHSVIRPAKGCKDTKVPIPYGQAVDGRIQVNKSHSEPTCF